MSGSEGGVFIFVSLLGGGGGYEISPAAHFLHS